MTTTEGIRPYVREPLDYMNLLNTDLLKRYIQGFTGEPCVCFGISFTAEDMLYYRDDVLKVLQERLTPEDYTEFLESLN